MWVFTSTGMLSVVAHRELQGSLLVRARSPFHIREMFPTMMVHLKKDLKEFPRFEGIK